MREEVEAHALYEKSAALSRTLSKLRASPSAATQKSMSLHQLVEKHLSNAASLSEQLTAPAENTDQPLGDLAAMNLQAKDLARTLSKHTMHTFDTGTEHLLLLDRLHQQEQPPLVMGREAQLLLGPCRPSAANTCCEALSESVERAKPKVADPGEAVTLEEKYHRAGREVLGQHVDVAAAALTAQEHAKHRMKAEKLRRGYTPLQHQAAAAVDSNVSSFDQLGSCIAAPCRFQYASAV